MDPTRRAPLRLSSAQRIHSAIGTLTDRRPVGRLVTRRPTAGLDSVRSAGDPRPAGNGVGDRPLRPHARPATATTGGLPLVTPTAPHRKARIAMSSSEPCAAPSWMGRPLLADLPRRAVGKHIGRPVP
jgi:hypothetical protein